MKKIGILTFHYSNNYGGVLQAVALYNAVLNLGFDVQIINFIPQHHTNKHILSDLGLRKDVIFSKYFLKNSIEIVRKILIKMQYSKLIIVKFDSFRLEYSELSQQVNEDSIETLLNDYSAIIVGSDQLWNPSQRKSPIYFLNFADKYFGRKISYSVDSTTKEISFDEKSTLEKALVDFDHISVRNEHSFEFVKKVLNIEPVIVADPTLLYDFESLKNASKQKDDYILMYVLGNEISGSHEKVIEKIRGKYGDLPVYSIKIPTTKFEISSFADKNFYDLGPSEWINMFLNAKFVYTDSFHGVLFSLKFHKPFIAYYTEVLRATRFVDLGKRYGIEKYIIRNTTEIEDRIFDELPNFNEIDNIIDLSKKSSIEFLKNALSNKENFD